MPQFDINSLGFGGSTANDTTDINNPENPVVETTTGEATDLNKEPDKSVDTTTQETVETTKTEELADKSVEEKPIEYAEGTEVTIGNDVYTFDKDGNLVDKDNNVFKTKDEVADFFKEFTVEESKEQKPSYDLETVHSLLGVDVFDEKGKAVQFENTEEGIKQYIDAVMEIKTDEAANAGVNQLFEQYPILKDFLTYYVANGNSAVGFDQVKDRSAITLDETNEAQQEAIIREAYKEFGRGGNVDTYIQYLKDTKQLAAVAKSELESLQNADAARKEEYDRRAAEQQQQAQEQEIAYWQNVHDTISNRVIGGYKIPETVVIERDGKQVAVTPDDFFNYLYQVDKDGNSRYMYDLAKQDPKQRFDDEILRAWLTYTGKGYNSLIDMAVANKQVEKLKLVANKNKGNKQTISIKKPAKTTNKVDTGSFGY